MYDSGSLVTDKRFLQKQMIPRYLQTPFPCIVSMQTTQNGCANS